MRNELINLVTSYKDSNKVNHTDIKEDIFANKMSLMMNEFYVSQTSNLKPKYTFEIDVLEWEDCIVCYDNKEYVPTMLQHKLGNNLISYTIVRTYNKNNSMYITVR